MLFRSVEVFDVIGRGPGKPMAPQARMPAPSPRMWPRGRKPGKALRPTPGLANLTMTEAGIPVVGMSVCGFEPEQLDPIVAMIADKLVADQDFIPVFLTDSLHAEIFRKHRFAFEYFPLSQESRRLSGTTAWSDYAAARLDMIKRKYGITRIVTFGKLPFCKA